MADKKYYIGANKALTTKQGIKGEGVEVTPGKDFPEKNLDALMKRDIIVTTKPDTRTKAEITKDRETKKLADKTKAAGAKKGAKTETKDGDPAAGAQKA